MMLATAAQETAGLVSLWEVDQLTLCARLELTSSMLAVITLAGAMTDFVMVAGENNNSPFLRVAAGRGDVTRVRDLGQAAQRTYVAKVQTATRGVFARASKQRVESLKVIPARLMHLRLECDDVL